MRLHASLILTASIVGTLGLANVALAAGAAKPEMTGKQIAFDKTLGNCLACHAMPTVPDAESAGTIGPPLIAMQARYPDKAKLRAQIWNAMDANPNTVMIPFGKNKVLTEEEIDKVTDFVYGL
ncbi:MAG: sulfur oxidation c-type cytochrome SoxX [Sulfuriferula sp.]|jgi:L-cysteine S-thiosulfotransferase|nr:sulfur oxidation c-type cytochrome SoxX [Sulfuriferula sp.]